MGETSKDSQDESPIFVRTNITNENKGENQPLDKSFIQMSARDKANQDNGGMTNESTDTKNSGFDNEAGIIQIQSKSNSSSKMVDNDLAKQESSKVSQDKSPFFVHSNETHENEIVRLPLDKSSGQMSTEDNEDQQGITKISEGIDTPNKEGDRSLFHPNSK